MAEKNCSRCDKQGFPVFLARYALGYGDMPNAVKNGVKLLHDMPTLNSQEDFYTLRTLYNGYVYLFDPTDSTPLRCFQVSSEETAVLTEIQIKSPATNNATMKKHASCALSGLTANKTPRYGNAVLLTIPRANQPRTVYVTFSQNFWNNALIQLNTQLANVKKYMTPIKVGGTNEFSKPINQLGMLVFEYANKRKNAVSWSENPINKGELLKIPSFTFTVINEAHRLNKSKGIIVPIFDPISLCNDIDGLLEFKRNSVLTTQEKSLLKYYGELKEFKSSLYTSARTQCLHNEIENRKNVIKFSTGRSANMSEVLEIIQNPVTTARIASNSTKIGNDNFNLFFKKLSSPNALELWYKNTIQAKYRNFYQNKASKLDQFFIQLVKSNIVASYMHYQFDENNILSGIQYSNAVTAMFGQMQLYDKSFAYICELLRGKIADKKNYILRSLVWGQTSLIQTISGLSYELNNNPFVDKSWSVLFGAVANIFGRNTALLSEASFIADTIDKAVAYTFKQAAIGQIKLSNLSLAWGANQNKIVSFLTIQGTHAQLSHFFANYIHKLAGSTISAEDLKKITNVAMTEFMIAQGATSPIKSNPLNFVLQVSLMDLKKLIQDIKISGTFQRDGLKVILKNVPDFYHYLHEYHKKEFKVAAVAGVKESYRLARAASIFQILNLGIFMYRLGSNNNLDNSLSLLGGSMNTLSMAFAMMDQKVRTEAIKMEKALTAAQTRNSARLLRLAVGTALAGGVFFAVVDGRATYAAYQEGNPFGLYMITTGLGVTATGTGIWALMSGKPMVPNIATFVITVVYIGLSIYLSKTKLEPIQKTIMNSPWGTQANSLEIDSQILNFQNQLRALS